MASQDMRKEDRAAIHKIYVKANPKLPEQPVLITRGMIWGAVLGGAVGGAVSSVGATPEQYLVDFLAQHDIHIEQIAAKSVADRLAGQHVFEVADAPADADATLTVDVVVYGIGYTAGMFSSDYRAMLNVRATMTRPDGKVVWIKQDVESALSGDRPAVPLDAMFADAEVMRAQFVATADKAASELLAQIDKAR